MNGYRREPDAPPHQSGYLGGNNFTLEPYCVLIHEPLPSIGYALFASWAFTQHAKDAGLLPSMGGVAACYDYETAGCRRVGLILAYD